MPLRYHVSNGRICTWSLEVHLVHHCNLTCTQCCTLSPYLPSYYLPLETLAHDLELAARVVRPSILKLTGGEPLLHPELVECLSIARTMAMADTIQVTTNGILARKVPEKFWTLLDRLTVSHYSSAPLSLTTLAHIEEQCARHRVHLTVKQIDSFAVMHDLPHVVSPEPAPVFETCWLRNRCHMVADGRFYMCTRPPRLERALGMLGVKECLSESDGISLDGPAQQFLDYLESSAPLASCKYCLGAGHHLVSHRQEGSPSIA